MSSYSMFEKPAFSPPGFIFPIVWTVLYILMGIPLISFIPQTAPINRTLYCSMAYSYSLTFWSIIFFGLDLYLFAFIWLIALIFIIISMIKQFYIVSPTAAYLQIPYLIWCIFAAYLNFYIFLLN
ncbi:TspO/MBR family protein [[Clostridium] symbiosum]|uniref:TspO/MBR family protein n=1 Tax=Clostridium symbiosum TaxID=1512 RepID=UPI003A7F4A31